MCSAKKSRPTSGRVDNGAAVTSQVYVYTMCEHLKSLLQSFVRIKKSGHREP